MAIETAVLFTALSVRCTLFASLRAMRTDTDKDSRESATMFAKLDSIENGINEIKSELKNVKSDVKSLEQRVTKLETIMEMKGEL